MFCNCPTLAEYHPGPIKQTNIFTHSIYLQPCLNPWDFLSNIHSQVIQDLMSIQKLPFQSTGALNSTESLLLKRDWSIFLSFLASYFPIIVLDDSFSDESILLIKIIIKFYKELNIHLKKFRLFYFIKYWLYLRFVWS